MTVVEFTFRFIDSTLSAFKQSECLPAPKALEMLNVFLDSRVLYLGF